MSYPEPSLNCSLCPRLHAFIAQWRLTEPQWYNAPVKPFLPQSGIDTTRLLIVGLAPGLRGANRTGRPFTGDYAGVLLYSSLKKFGFATGQFDARPDDSLQLIDTTIVNAVRCVPPENKPLGNEINTCQQFFSPLLKNLPHLSAVITLGTIAHQSTIKALGEKINAHPFGHGKITNIGRLRIFSSYHCSRYNTNTGRLSEDMFHDIFASVQNYLQTRSS
ncbi:uracil-DNA glycosylase [Bartonella tamiae]|uniref:Type-5 uracil-DNA glycosylase n=1 Tax=Bartonella tamiae Th239 TaxID=1094558 RepID=J0ZPU3_9HYPH|nr:uracil-DNA glycosylase [Bartonella tamiae]EJF90623.1 uracil-DNA glycosylase, family 4 [Bartonella tamiae Th239]EJF94000.1 uracil-DNA glycosylase, family 4 [Bartonella tamiae Th307]